MGTLFSTLVSLGFLALLIWAVVEVAGSQAEVGFKVLWILLLLFLPLIGLIAWAIVGPRRVREAP